MSTVAAYADLGDQLAKELRESLREADTLSAVERAPGLKRQALAKFRRGEQSLRLDWADKLAVYFRIELRRKRGEETTDD